MPAPRTRPTARLAVVAATLALAGVALAGGARWHAARTLEDARQLATDVGERLGGELQAVAATARRRAEQVAALRTVRMAVETDRSAAQRVVRTDGLTLAPLPGETIEIFQLLRGGRLVSLLRAPLRARPLPLRQTRELRIYAGEGGDRGALVVLVATPVDPLYAREPLGGAVGVATRLPLAELAAPLPAEGLAASLTGPGLAAPLPLSPLPTLAGARVVTAAVPLPAGTPALTVRAVLAPSGGVALQIGRALLVAAFALASWTLFGLRRRGPARRAGAGGEYGAADDEYGVAAEDEYGSDGESGYGAAPEDGDDALESDDVGAATIRQPLQDRRSSRPEARTVPDIRFPPSRAQLVTSNVPDPVEDDPTEKQGSAGHLVLAWSQPMPTPISRLDPQPTGPLQLPADSRAELLSHRYRLLHLLGRGESAEVYLAQSFVSGGGLSTVALKLLAPGAPTGAGERFLAEARRQQRVVHPNVVQIHEVGVEPFAYVAMEYIEGCTLAKLMSDLIARGEPLPLPQALAIVAAIAHALDAAQAARDEHGLLRPLVHGAVEPSNVLVGRHGAIKLGDFGVPPSASERRAPEQYAGKPADRRSDVYALGVILHELVSNRQLTPPPRGPTTSWPPLPAPSSLRPELPRALDAIVARATRFGPRGRYADAAELLAELRVATAHAAADERPSGVLGDWVERARRSS